MDYFHASIAESLSGYLSADSPLDSDVFTPFEFEVVTSVEVLGQTDPVHYLGPIGGAQQVAAGGIIEQAAKIVNDHAAELDKSETQAILAVKSIEVVTGVDNGKGRDAVNPSNGTWTVSIWYLGQASRTWMASLLRTKANTC